MRFNELGNLLYQVIDQVSGKPKALSDSVRDVNGGFITGNMARIDRCHEHFEHLLNFDEQTITPALPSSAYAVSCEPTSEGEVTDAIQRPHHNTALGDDGIPAEIYKACVEIWHSCSMS
ncbi:unnamed protein product [Schistocephalus solidus]|uniref:Uncharacterized protein n=1 Tax=Schistocephalus solidus TaxID=70667 RepID=A0A183TJT9_SCHSO|nr:unnamed protein product [Schistocephalus solidus]